MTMYHNGSVHKARYVSNYQTIPDELLYISVYICKVYIVFYACDLAQLSARHVQAVKCC